MVTFTLLQSVWEFPKLRAIRAMCASVVYEPNACQLFIFTGQRANKCANVPKVCQLFNLACQRAKSVLIFELRLPKGVPIFQLFFRFSIFEFFNYFSGFQFLNFSIMLNICKFQEYLGNSSKLILRNKEFRF